MSISSRTRKDSTILSRICCLLMLELCCSAWWFSALTLARYWASFCSWASARFFSLVRACALNYRAFMFSSSIWRAIAVVPSLRRSSAAARGATRPLESLRANPVAVLARSLADGLPRPESGSILVRVCTKWSTRLSCSLTF